jgi:hypothetical protein
VYIVIRMCHDKDPVIEYGEALKAAGKECGSIFIVAAQI